MGKDRHHRRHERDSDDEDRRERKKHKKDRKESKKSAKSERHRHRDRDERLPAGAPHLTESDYFVRATEFRVWLARSKGKYVEELSTDESTALFRDGFVRKWNRGRLPREYYAGLPDALVEQTRRTRHSWGFVSTLDERERLRLASAKDSVDVATRKTDLLASGHPAAAPPARERGPAAREEEDDDDRDDRRRRERGERKRRRRDRESDLDELAPRETGREAAIEKRRETARRIHGSARDREENRDGLDLSEDFLMGGGGRGNAELQDRLARREAARHQRDQARLDRVADLKAKEDARMDQFLADMGLTGATKPVTIAPRPRPS